jgi:hypothetical protein
MRLRPALISVGCTTALMLLGLPPAGATVMPSLVPGVSGTPSVNSPGPVSVNTMPSLPNVSPTTTPYMPESNVNPVTVPDSQPSYDESYQVLPLYESAPLTPKVSPVSLLYTGPQDGPSVPGSGPLLFNSPNTVPGVTVNDLFAPDPPTTSNITIENKAPISFVSPVVVPEPRLASFMAVAAALALGILVARRRKKEASSSLEP